MAVGVSPAAAKSVYDFGPPAGQCSSFFHKDFIDPLGHSPAFGRSLTGCGWTSPLS